MKWLKSLYNPIVRTFTQYRVGSQTNGITGDTRYTVEYGKFEERRDGRITIPSWVETLHGYDSDGYVFDITDSKKGGTMYYEYKSEAENQIGAQKERDAWKRDSRIVQTFDDSEIF